MLIVIINYNEVTTLNPKLLSNCITSTVKTKYPNHLLKIIIADNASKDESIKFVIEIPLLLI